MVFLIHVAERYCNTLLELDPPRTAEAARVLTAIIETPEKYSNQNGKTMYQYWDLLCQLIMDHPEGIDMPQQDHLVPTGELSSLRPDHLDVELILKTGTKKFTDHVGMLWNSLARWWILQGKFERARDVFEEGIRTVNTVKDFTMIFDAYAKMEETVLSDAMTKVGQEGEFDETDVDLRLARFERLLTRRPFLVSDVILRQNPHNVQEWKNRVQLYLEEGNIDKVIETYTTASKTINPHRCQDNATEIWFEVAKFHEDRDEIDEARNVIIDNVGI
jgi:pre-mRNA-splicing factor SYF1